LKPFRKNISKKFIKILFKISYTPEDMYSAGLVKLVESLYEWLERPERFSESIGN